jgi:hypothetical protein
MKDSLIRAQVGHIDVVNTEMIRLQDENKRLKEDQWLSIYYLKEFRSRISKDSGIYNELNKRIKNSELLAKAVKR